MKLVWNDAQIRALARQLPRELVDALRRSNRGIDRLYGAGRDPLADDGGYFLIYERPEDFLATNPVESARMLGADGEPAVAASDWDDHQLVAGHAIVRGLVNNETMVTRVIPDAPWVPAGIRRLVFGG